MLEDSLCFGTTVSGLRRMHSTCLSRKDRLTSCKGHMTTVSKKCLRWHTILRDTRQTSSGLTLTFMTCGTWWTVRVQTKSGQLGLPYLVCSHLASHGNQCWRPSSNWPWNSWTCCPLGIASHLKICMSNLPVLDHSLKCGQACGESLKRAEMASSGA